MEINAENLNRLIQALEGINKSLANMNITLNSMDYNLETIAQIADQELQQKYPEIDK